MARSLEQLQQQYNSIAKKNAFKQRPQGGPRGRGMMGGKPKSAKKTIARLLTYMRGFRFRFGLVLACMLLTTITSLFGGYLLAPIINSTDNVGGLTQKAASELGLKAGTPVYGGGGDTTFVNIGAGCTKPGDTHIYVGTSGWVSTFLDYQTVDINAMITGVMSAKRGCFNYFAELETAGKCFEWVMKHLALDEINIYLKKTKVTEDIESKYKSLYDYLSAEVSKVPAGANGVIFTPWLHGNRCPFEDSNAAGMFFNIKLETGKRELIRAVLEGICYHLRWMLECEAKKVKTSDKLRFVGGGSLSPVTCQILADITCRTVETVDNTQEVGAIGTALVVAAGIKKTDVLKLSQQLIKPNRVYKPDPENKEVYERNYRVFKKLYKANASNFKDLNA